jgi:hypothetical protein
MKDELLDLLNDLEQYMDDRADIADGNSGHSVANTEMVLLLRIQEAIAQVKKPSKFEIFVKTYISDWEDGMGATYTRYLLAKKLTQ